MRGVRGVGGSVRGWDVHPNHHQIPGVHQPLHGLNTYVGEVIGTGVKEILGRNEDTRGRTVGIVRCKEADLKLMPQSE